MFTQIRHLRTLLTILTCSILGLSTLQAAAQETPALLYKETWQQSESALGRPTSPHASPNQYYLASQRAVSNAALELNLYGEKARDITVYEHEGRIDLWTGLAGSPVAITLKARDAYLDLSGLARVRAIVRTNNLHQLRPVIKLPDGAMAVGSQTIDTRGAFLTVEVAFDNQDWYALDPVEVVVGNALAEPDMSLVDEVGFVNLAPGGGHGNAGWSNVSHVEIYANAVAR